MSQTAETKTDELQAFAPTGRQIIGTLESVTARSEIAYFYREGDKLMYEHSGGSEMFYDGMETETRGGKVLFLADDGLEYTADELRFKDERGRFVKSAPLVCDDDGKPSQLDKITQQRDQLRKAATALMQWWANTQAKDVHDDEMPADIFDGMNKAIADAESES